MAHALTSAGHDASEDGTGRGTPIVAPALVKRYGKGTDSDATDTMVVAPTLREHVRPGSNIDTTIVQHVTAFHQTQDPIHGDVSPALGVTSGGMGASIDASVRRLTPTECERLQALPDGWTRLDEKTPDSRRYAALGDAVTASVGFWIGRRLISVAAT